jgi:hypothetical protein
MTTPAAGSLPPPPAYQDASRYDDVWARDDDICAYCGTAVGGSGARCAGCGRRLERRGFLYDAPSTNLVILWVLVAASGFLYLILVLGDLIQGSGLGLILVHAILGLIFLVLSAAIYLREFWAWAASIPILLVTLFLSSLRVIGVDTTVNVITRLEEASHATLSSSFLQSLVVLLYGLLLVAQGGALLAAVFLVAPDFSRRGTPLLARLDHGLVNAADYFLVGRRYAKRGLWATAILHWQRAAAQAPHNWRYQLALAEGYAHLGFFERSADVLQSAEACAPGHAKLDVKRFRQRLAQQVAGKFVQ